MRWVLLLSILGLAPIQALAECTCVCVRGTAQGLCSEAAETPPLCQQLCPIAVAPAPIQSQIVPQSLGGSLGGGSGIAAPGSGPLGAATAGQALRARGGF